MHELHLLLILHLIGATIWVGGHIVLLVNILPQVWKFKNTDILFNFEQKYEKLGMPALAVMVITGVRMAYLYNIKLANWFQFTSPIEKVISTKLCCLFVILILALSAQFFVLPKLKTNIKYLPLMSFHMITVTLISITMLVLGSFIRYGGLN
ncbi:CopD family protein [Myroides sp. JBRI-B21084]|uniref:CopD family protein n=1 Tax=Myroides sp. JBRI-B21084 TaxID=3119977 RepID=UPI0026E3B300|nr:CopD family protein [Paenimyroides cloacae]WKW46523.1 CopD family protein [Paenimyroides cloacae]